MTAHSPEQPRLVEDVELARAAALGGKSYHDVLVGIEDPVVREDTGNALRDTIDSAEFEGGKQHILSLVGDLETSYPVSHKDESLNPIGRYVKFAPYEPLHAEEPLPDPDEQVLRTLLGVESLPKVASVIATAEGGYSQGKLAEEAGYTRASVTKTFEKYLIPLGLVKVVGIDAPSSITRGQRGRAPKLYQRTPVFDRYVDNLQNVQQAIRLRTLAHKMQKSEQDTIETLLSFGESGVGGVLLREPQKK